jgi:hypothetical protein
MQVSLRPVRSNRAARGSPHLQTTRAIAETRNEIKAEQ